MPILKDIPEAVVIGLVDHYEAGDIRIMPGGQAVDFYWIKATKAVGATPQTPAVPAQVVARGTEQVSFADLKAILGAAEYALLLTHIKAAAYKVLQARGVFPAGAVS